MSSDDFQQSVQSLAARIAATIETFFNENTMNWAEFEKHASQDIAQLATDAHMFGADIYAETITA